MEEKNSKAEDRSMEIVQIEVGELKNERIKYQSGQHGKNLNSTKKNTKN